MLTKFLFWLTARMPAKAINLKGRYYIERYHVRKIGKLHIMLHRYLGADGDRTQHDHPWRWALGIPLRGGYTEERLTAICPISGAITKRVRIRAWRWNVISDRRFHRVAHVEPYTWTLFITYRRYKFWGEMLPDPYHQKQLIYRPVSGIKPTPENWYESPNVLHGAEFCRARGTDAPPPSRIGSSHAWGAAALVLLIISMNIPQ